VFSRRVRLWLGLVCLAWFALLFGLAEARFVNVHNRTFDLALYARIAWGLSGGDLSTQVLDSVPLGTHISPVLLPLGVLGRLFGTVHVLLSAQALCVALCVFPIARIGARHMGRPGLTMGVAAWLLYPNLCHVAAYEFHPGTLAVLPMCWAFDALDRGQLRDLSLCCAALLLCREDLGAMAVIFALLAFMRFQQRGALWLGGCCALYTALATSIVLAHAPAVGSLDQHFGVWGGSPLGVFSALVHDPARVLAHFRAPEKLLYLPRLLAVLSFFPLRAGRLLLPAAPYLALNLLSAFPTSAQQYSHYLTPAVPALVVAGVVGATALRKRALRALWFFTLALGHYAMGGSPLSRDFEREAFRADAASHAARAVLAEIGPQQSVQAPDALLPHLAERPTLRRAPPPLHDTRYVVLDVSHRQRYARREDLLRTSEEPFVRAFFARADHGLVAYAPPYALFERGRAQRASAAVQSCFEPPTLTSASERALSACIALRAATLEQDTLHLTLVARGPCPVDLALRFGTTERPGRVELLCGGRLSPAQLAAGDVLRSSHLLDAKTARAARSGLLWIGVLRENGEPPSAADPFAVPLAPGQHAAP
jgi:uncharacterized membrane protein